MKVEVERALLSWKSLAPQVSPTFPKGDDRHQARPIRCIEINVAFSLSPESFETTFRIHLYPIGLTSIAMRFDGLNVPCTRLFRNYDFVARLYISFRIYWLIYRVLHNSRI